MRCHCTTATYITDQCIYYFYYYYSTGQEAALAMASLRNTHLYGRHLVLEWAKEEDDQEGEVTGMAFR